MVSITILGVDGAPAGEIEVSGAWSDEQALSAVRTMNGLVVRVQDLLGGLQATGALRDPAAIPLGQTAHGVTHGSLDGRLRIVKGLDDDSLVTVGGQVHGYLKAADSLGHYLGSSRGQGQQRFRAKLAQGRARVALIGDSWGNIFPFPQGIKDKLCGLEGQGKYPHAEYGWVSCFNTLDEDGAMDGVSLRYSGGWKQAIPDLSGGGRDVSYVSRHEVYEWGPDGYQCRAMGTAGTVVISDAAGAGMATAPAFDTYTVYYYDGDGQFRVRIDDGDWVTVTGAGSGGWAKRVIAGLDDTGHVVTLDLNGNSGTVVLYGHYLGRSAGTGVSFSALGHRGARAYSWGGLPYYIGNGILRPAGLAGDGRNFAWEMLRDMGFDTYMFVIGTNDARTLLRDNFVYGVTETIRAVKAMGAGTGVILAPSPRSYPSPTKPVWFSERSLAEDMYRIASSDFAQTDDEAGVDVWDLFSAVGPYATAKALGYYASETPGGDGNHLSLTGGRAAGLDFIQTGIL